MKNEILNLALNLCEIPSVSGDGKAVSIFLCQKLKDLGFIVEKIPVDNNRFNILAYFRRQKFQAIFCTHMDTVAPFIAPSFDRNLEIIYGRGSLDAKGIISSMVFSALKQKQQGFDDIALLFTVGEEEASDGAKACGMLNNQAKFLIVGEPTD